MLTIAYIGNGKSTNRYHLPFSLKLRDKIQVKTIFSRKADSSWPKIAGINYTNNIDDIYGDPNIGLVVVTTPSQTHYALAKEVLEHGKNVLVEKPFTETAEQARTLFRLAKEKGLFVQCYQNRRFDSDFLTTKKVIQSGLLGDLLEVEMHYDYYRPQVPEAAKTFSVIDSYLYGHACHTLDQVISFFGKPAKTHFDVRQLLGPGRMNDYFDLDLYYDGPLKVSVKSSYFRLKARPSFVLYGKKGAFVKETKDRQETDLKHFYMPDHADFGIDRPEDYGTLTYLDDQDHFHEEKVVSEIGDYSDMYAGIYDAIVKGQEKPVKDDETVLQLELLEEAIAPIAG